MRKQKFGVFLPFYAFKKLPPKEYCQYLVDIAVESERLGYDSVWLDDHLMYQNWPILDCWTTLSYLAASTKKIRLGTMVTCNSHRNPAILAKTASTIDALSNGRLEFGIGAGIQEHEHIAYGFDFAKPSSRIEQLGEALEVIKQLWTLDKANYKGKHYTLKEAFCEPKPTQKPHPPLIVGGSGNKLLKFTAKYADRFDWGYVPTVEEYKRKLKLLEVHCKRIGRNFGEIEKACWPEAQILIRQTHDELNTKYKRSKPHSTVLEESKETNRIGTPIEFIERLKTYRELGASYFMLFFADLPSNKSLTVFSEKVIKKLS